MKALNILCRKKEYQNKRTWLQKLKDQKYLYVMSLPFVLMVFVFSYIPIWGWSIAFQDYKLGLPFWEQSWVGFKHFITMFQDDKFYTALANTFGMSMMGLLLGFTIPIIFAILINELRHKLFKQTVQTISYLPHFVSWVVVAGIVYKMLSTDSGPINQLIQLFGGEPVQFMAKPELFWGIVVLSDLWKEMGWNTIIFLAAVTAIDPALYEAAKIDGAGRFRRIWHVTLPGISNVIIVLLVLSIGNLMSIGFEKQFQLQNNVVAEKAMVLDLYALVFGIGNRKFGFGAAIGVAKSVLSLILLFTANALFKKQTGKSVM
ncbi:MAG: sugar ABC transporter permease [Spirochaetales bacterium]|nr:sugar ABC transporter permease [Spirochaetales bacterium]